mmetsp:Transcript_14933/g.24322  ORF Transcript_14933/g.24322 Transcript_14933/m.24322 type:complete len:660 (+) Transcript_14933:368-2347(+)|eukprot:CAMPEP_0203762126 /NCGR_PEP_ID=MMETSP0098-20131031/15078_1 /ASSEMBLY_ACC=CAM_ASM_000208 /TAXON_ID=96639 /ORGANISM=" , Strain NY0313808BC1" /LENGTH=659 /DNA_ID=CAMNT_0050656415 /DNA_START=299 /DNA_END=2278 /DNA_ORIENTATION=-
MSASLEVPGSARPDLGLGGIRRCALPVGPELSVDGNKTIFEVFQTSVKKYPRHPCAGYRPIASDGTALDYIWFTYKQMYERAINFGNGLINLDLCPESADGLSGLGFYAKNRLEYVFGDMGCYSKGIVPIPLYDTLGAEAVEYAVRQTEIKTIFCTSAEMTNVMQVSKKGLLTSVILMDGEFLNESQVNAIKQEGSAAGLRVFTSREVEERGASNPTPFRLPKGDDTAFFCYTSGTTGDPKGVMVTHQGILSCLTSVRHYGIDMTCDEVHLSYLPLPHVFERGIFLAVLYGGGRVGFYQGDTLKILEDIQALRPTIFPSVPRLLNRVHDKIIMGVEEAGGVKKWMFEKALASKVAGLKSGSLTHPIWDRLVFGPLKTRLGFDRVRLMFTGSAPISDNVMNFLRAVFGCNVLEGFGQSESSQLVSLTIPGDFTTGHVGVPAPCNEIRLIDVPEMGYLCTDKQHNDGSKCFGRGEIAYRGPNVFKKYYKMPEKTAETVTPDGWCLTGDIGLWNADGKLRIIDRKKNIFKLSQGEYVAAERIENVVTANRLILQCFVYGDSLQSQLVAIVVPDPEALEADGLKAGSQETKDAIMKAIMLQAKEAKLKGFEIPRAIHVVPGGEDFQTLGLLTPTFKLKRNIAKEQFESEITQLYQQLMSKSKL